MNNFEKLKTINSTIKYADEYIDKAESLFTQSKDEFSIRSLADEIHEYRIRMKSRWLKGLFVELYPSRKSLKQYYDHLVYIEQMLIRRVVEIQRDRKTMRHLEQMAIPEPTNANDQQRDFRTTNSWPMRYSGKLLNRLSNGRLPE